MSSNAIGTLFRIVGICIFLILVWLIPVVVFYYVVCLVIGIEFSLSGALLVFAGVVVVRAFYSKNVFQG